MGEAADISEFIESSWGTAMVAVTVESKVMVRKFMAVVCNGLVLFGL